MTNIVHDQNRVDIEKTIEVYSDKEGVDIKYVCTTEFPDQGIELADVFYRETPHPEFGNRYFGLYYMYYQYKIPEEVNTNAIDFNQKLTELNPVLLIFNAGDIEDMNFAMIQDSKGKYHYSAYRHHYNQVDNKFVDGGRGYTRTNTSVKVFHVVNGEFRG
jgi:hypothetical protein